MFESPSWLLSCQGSVGIIPTLYLRSSLNISIHFDQRITAVPLGLGADDLNFSNLRNVTLWLCSPGYQPSQSFSVIGDDVTAKGSVNYGSIAPLMVIKP
jgi:hypothetical protein